MIDRQSLVVMTPSHHGEVCTGYVSGLLQCSDLIGGTAFIVGMSEINLARNLMVNAFLNLPEQFEWLVMIDADLEFSRQDFLYLCEEFPLMDYTAVGEGVTATHAIVSAEYARRPIDARAPTPRGPAKLAVGFARIHRQVFAALREVKNSEGHELVQTFFRQGQVLHDYFPTGAQGDGHWLSEDHGFFRLCQLAGIIPRIECRAQLIHWGRHGARYESGVVASPALD